jgi:hypothetical protein
MQLQRILHTAVTSLANFVENPKAVPGSRIAGNYTSFAFFRGSALNMLKYIEMLVTGF